jgi:hypothetical protein
MWVPCIAPFRHSAFREKLAARVQGKARKCREKPVGGMKLRKSFKAISIAGATVAAIALSVSPASAANYWNVRLENVWSIKCLGVGSSGANGAPALQWDCNDSSDEHWDLVERSDNPEFKTIKNRYSGKCLGVGGQTGNGATVIQWDCNGAADENWLVMGGQFINQYSRKSIGVGASTANGAKAIQYTVDAGRDQLWGTS